MKPSTANVAELFEPRRFHMLEMPVPPPGPGEVQVRVRSVGICGSDLHYYSVGSIGDVDIKYPVVLGHEPAGEIVSAGDSVTGFTPGARALLEPAVYCYHCEFCRSGHHNVCEHIRFFSTPPDPGFFRSVMNLPAHNVLPLPPELDLNVGTMFEPLAVAVHSMEFAQVRIGEDVVVFGGGPIGLFTIACLRVSGASRIWCVEPLAHRREMAKLMGATAVIDPGAVDPVREILNDTGKRGADAVLDCATRGDSIQQCFDSVRNRGRVVITGIPWEATTVVNFHVLRRKEAMVYNVRRSNHETDAAVSMLRADPKRFAQMITHTPAVDNLERAFEMLETGDGGAVKIVVQV